MPEVGPTAALVPVKEFIQPPLRKRRSCELVNTPSPCVRKALFHLGRLKALLKIALENPPPVKVPVKQYEGLFRENVAKPIDHTAELQHPVEPPQQPKTWKHLRFDVPQHSESSMASSSSGDESPALDGVLAITGIGGHFADLETGDTLQVVKMSSVHISQLEKKNQLPPQEVFTQVRELVLRLEDDRRLTEYHLGLEKGKVESLGQRIDTMCRKRLIQLPIAVQKEHDACSTDISELHWHVAYMERQLDRCKQRVQVAEVLNTRLKDDISFVKKHCPLVEEKLILEKDAMQKIRTMQKQTDHELSDARIELDKAEQKYQEAVDRAESERETTKTKLEGIRGQLRLLKKDLQHSEAMHKAYVKKAEQSREKLTEQEQEMVNLQQRAEEAKEEEQEEIYKIEDLRQQVKEVEFETGEVNKQKARVEIEIEKLHEDMKMQIKAQESKYHHGLQTLRRLQEENRDMKLDIEDMNDEIKLCDKTMAKCDKEIERYKKERERCDAQLKEASAEVAQVTVINTELKNQLQKEESKAQALEDALKTQADSLRKNVMEEMRQRTALEAKKQSNSQALLKGRSENKKRRNKVNKTLTETENSVSKIKSDVEKLREQHATTTQIVEELEEKLLALKTKHAEEERELLATKSVLEPQERQLLSTQTSLQTKIKEMEFEEEQMRQKLKDMLVSRGVMTKRMATTEENIEKLKEELEEVNLRLDTSRQTNEKLQKQLDQATKRLSDRKKYHHEMMETRLKVKKQLEQDIQQELSHNKILAQNYRDLQSEHTDLKNKLMSLYDNKVKLEASIKDHKQLLALQEKFNLALKQYYHDRGEYNKAGLQKFHNEAEDNSKNMVKIQGGLQMALLSISKFLRSQIEGGAANQVHEAAMKFLLPEQSAAAF